MNFLNTFLMWLPPCALFVAVAYVTECAWQSEDRTIRRRFVRRIIQARERMGWYSGDDTREVIYQEDGQPLCYRD